MGTVHKDLKDILPEYVTERDDYIREKRAQRLQMDSLIIEELQEAVESGEAEMPSVVSYDKAREREAKLLGLYEQKGGGGEGVAKKVVDILSDE